MFDFEIRELERKVNEYRSAISGATPEMTLEELAAHCEQRIPVAGYRESCVAGRIIEYVNRILGSRK